MKFILDLKSLPPIWHFHKRKFLSFLWIPVEVPKTLFVLSLSIWMHPCEWDILDLRYIFNGAKESKNEKLLLMPAVPSCQHLGEFFIPPAIHFIFLCPTLPTSELRNSTHSSERKVAFFLFFPHLLWAKC
jgi:hypothetical protein